MCGQPITDPAAARRMVEGHRVCTSVDCRRVLAQKAGMPAAAFAHHLALHRRQQDQRRFRLEERRRQIELLTAREEAEDRAIRDRALSARGEVDPAAVHLVAIPSGRSAIAPLPESRIAAYREHLRSIVAEAAEQPDAASMEDAADRHSYQQLADLEARLDAQPALRSALDTACGCCRGGCCARGGEEAYLSALGLRRWLDAHPECGPEDLLARYEAHIASETVEGSCVNQTATGCALPRELRSEICNRYYCGSLEEYLDQVDPAADPGPTLLVRRSNTAWDRFEDGVNAVEEVLWLEDGRVRVLDLASVHPAAGRTRSG